MYQKYNKETGEITCTYQITDDDAIAAMKKYDVNLAKGDGEHRTHYVDVHAIPPCVCERQPQATQQDKTELQSDGEDFVTLSGLPVPCVVKIGGEEYAVDDGIFEWATLRAGDYHIEVEAVPFLTWHGEVSAV